MTLLRRRLRQIGVGQIGVWNLRIGNVGVRDVQGPHGRVVTKDALSFRVELRAAGGFFLECAGVLLQAARLHIASALHRTPDISLRIGVGWSVSLAWAGCLPDVAEDAADPLERV
ncbi:hypothetical protein, partial [Sinomonas sp.]|uniref:hypothetical protein n=1 Tax=Sinomonas sp. TaxID=1914986 RepID=UPI002FE2CC15